MDKFTVAAAQGITIITAIETGIQLRVLDAATTTLPGDTPVIEATLYIEQGGFVPKCSYFFELINPVNHLTNGEVDADQLKAGVDFFFHSVLGTDLFVKSIPKASSLCPAERRHYHY
ncbi:hypothetical protein ACFQZS_16200 [Mucilaginibacter calamicampi]|uniref:Uncharacterized protein n=1 Tax=Mucilaginibacter calamicampi TaxID=1302352 RepID=A0ABW2YZ11_9SPHI